MSHGTSLPEVASTVRDIAALLAEHGWDDLKTELPDPDDAGPVRIAFVGPHNAGKSSLIASLTHNLSIKRSGKPETVAAARYPWKNGVELVDLPGWFSGFDAHDENANEDLRRHADLVVFVMTVELGDELVVDAIQYVFSQLAFAGQAIVVVNKAGTEDSDVAIIREEIERRLGEYAGVPIVTTDAQDYLDTISGEFEFDDESVAALRADSGMPQLEEQLMHLVSAEGASARSQAQRHQAVRVIDDATARVVPSDEEESLSSYTEDLADAIACARQRIDELAAAHLDQLEAAIAGLADDMIAGKVSTEEQVSTAWTGAWSFVDDLSKAARAVIDDLDDDRERIAIPFAASMSAAPSAEPRTSKTAAEPGLGKRVLDSTGLTTTVAAQKVSEFAKGFADGGSAPGSAAHKAAKKIRRGKKYAPHGQKKDAAKLVGGAKAATKAPVAVPVLEELWKWGLEHQKLRQERKSEQTLRDRYADRARSEREQEQVRFEEWAAGELEPFESELAASREALGQAAQSRELVRAQLGDLRGALIDELTEDANG